MRIAVTGGIGSGKSEVLKVAREMGFCCLSADEINAELLKDKAYIEKIKAQFPDSVKDGNINKAALAAEVFSDSGKRKLLNSIAHPEILKRITERKESLLIVEMPLLLESGSEKYFDVIIVVRADRKKRLEMLKGRGMDFERAEQIMDAQADEYALEAVATHILDNDGDLENLRAKSQALFSGFIQKF